MLSSILFKTPEKLIDIYIHICPHIRPTLQYIPERALGLLKLFCLCSQSHFSIRDGGKPWSVFVKFQLKLTQYVWKWLPYSSAALHSPLHRVRTLELVQCHVRIVWRREECERTLYLTVYCLCFRWNTMWTEWPMRLRDQGFTIWLVLSMQLYTQHQYTTKMDGA